MPAYFESENSVGCNGDLLKKRSGSLQRADTYFNPEQFKFLSCCFNADPVTFLRGLRELGVSLGVEGGRGEVPVLGAVRLPLFCSISGNFNFSPLFFFFGPMFWKKFAML